MNDSSKKDYYSVQQFTEEQLDENNSCKKMLRLIGENKQVIDFGCATGYFSQMLTQRGCSVTGVEINIDAAKIAENYCQQVIVSDLDLVSLAEILPKYSFDVAVFGDVLEHLRDPWRVLKELHILLKPDGYVVASIPNIAHGAIRLALLQGKFEYAEMGILDNTHLRFFTRKTIEELFESSGYFVESIDRTIIPVFSESDLIPNINANEFDSELVQKIEREEEADTLQFILRAFPLLPEGKYASLNYQYSKLITQLEQFQTQLQQIQIEAEGSQSQLQHTYIEKEQLQSQLQHTQAELEKSRSQLQHTQAELEKSRSQLQHTQSELENSQSQLQHAQAELERSQFQLQHIQAELERSQSQLQDTQTELENSQSQLHHAQTKLEQSQSQLQDTQTELERSQSQLQDTQTELENSQSQLQHSQAEVVRLQTLVSAMESSKFWKLRTVWFWLKRLLGLTDNSISLSPQTIELLGINDIREIKFKTASKNYQSGYFDGLNGSKVTKIKLPNPNPITASGWAIISDEGRPADWVIITYGYKKSLVAVAPVNVERLDVVVATNNPAYKKTGWRITFDGSNLPAGTGFFKAWAYNAERKEAIQLNYSTSRIKLKDSVNRLKYYYAVLKVKGVRYALSKSLKKLYQKLDNSQPLIEVIPASDQDGPYYMWLTKNFPREADLRKLAETVETFPYKPVISIIVPVFNTPEQFLRQAIESVLDQVYPYWELCIADDASTKPYVRNVLEEYSAKDSRIKIVFRKENGHISHASNSAIEIATGEFIALLDHDDLLTPDALYEVALLLNRYPEADMIYSDEDKVDERNQLKDPFFKPDWCPDSFLSKMYTCHLGTYRRSLVNQIEGFRVGFEGSQDYDFVLRFTEKTDKIFHIPKILYHWRIHLQSTSSGSEAKPYAYIAAEKALSEALCRRGEKGRVEGVSGYLGLYSIRYEIEEYKLVSIIIPTKDLGEMLDRCLTSIFNKTVYPDYEIIVIDNGSTEEHTAKVINYWESKEPNRFRCYKLDIPFNFSKINNYAVTQARGEYLLLLNNDTEVISPNWIDAMVEQAQRPCIGAVGGLLLYPDQSVQHAGIILGIGGVGSHSHKQLHSIFPGYFGQLVTINNYSAITAACLMCRREVYDRVGGFEENLAVAYNDVDFCLKLIEKGYRNIYLPHVVLYHYESKSRGSEDTPEKLARLTKEAEYVQKKWNNIIKNDPCYNPHLTRNSDDYSINI